MDPSGGSFPWRSAYLPSYPDQQAWESSHPTPVQEQMSYNHTAQDQDEFYPAQVQPASEGSLQIQQGGQQKPSPMSSLSNRELNTVVDTPDGSSSWTAAETPGYPDQDALQLSQLYQQGVQLPATSYSMPFNANNIQQEPNEFREDAESGTIIFANGAYYYQNHSGVYQMQSANVPQELVAVSQENRFSPLTNGNNPEMTPTRDERCYSTGSVMDQALPEPQYEDIDSVPGAREALMYAELGVKRQDPAGYQSGQHFVQCPQPTDFNDGQNLEDNWSFSHHGIFSQQLVANRQIDPISQYQDEIQVGQTRQNQSRRQRRLKTPSNKTSVRTAVRTRLIKKTPYKCHICEAFFVSQYGLRQHGAWIHTERNFVCMKCGKRFETQKTLDNHVKKHQLEYQPFKCSSCPKQFCENTDRRRHEFVHSGTKPHQCDWCPKSFSRNDHLLEHQQSKHSREQKLLENTIK